MSRRIAAVFGVNQYVMPDNDLRYAVADAEAIAEVLSSPPYDFEVHEFLDEEASRRRVLRTLKLVRESPRDLVVFYFAGHGVTTDTGTYLVTADAQFADDGIELSALAKALDAQGSPDTKTLALLDCCHSGAAGPRALTSRSMTIGDVTKSITNFSGTRAYMAACLPDKPSGSVWRVASYAGTKAAYKVYNPTELRNHEKLTRFRQGYEAMGRLNHPYIVKVHSLTACPLGFYMGLVDGINLREQGPPADDPSEVIVLLLAVADALRHAHGHDVIHRDIKPENIIMKYSAEKGRYEPFVTDFDLAWFSTATQLTNQAIGAMSYAAPEQLTPRLAETARRPAVDVYSFGQLAYFCVVDAHPVPLDYAGNQDRLAGALRSWGDPAAAQAFLHFYKACNQPNPETRLQTMQECRDALIAVGESLQSVAHDAPLSVEKLLDSIAYGLSGSTSRTIESPSGRTELDFSVQATAKPIVGKASLSIRVRPRQGFNRAGKSMHARRAEVNRQLDATLQSFTWATRSSGNDPGFEVFITMRQVDLKHSSSVACRNVLDRVVEVMER